MVDLMHKINILMMNNNLAHQITPNERGKKPITFHSKMALFEI